jgi:hypothetical protein
VWGYVKDTVRIENILSQDKTTSVEMSVDDDGSVKCHYIVYEGGFLTVLVEKHCVLVFLNISR